MANLKVSGYEPFALDDRGVTFVRRRVKSSAPPEKTLLGQISSHQCLCPDRVRVSEFYLPDFEVSVYSA